MMLGETAMLDGAGRTASAIADTRSVLFELSHGALIALSASDPALGARLYLNIATHLSQRLRNTAAAWRASTN